jgi:hypothetical protein
LAARNVLLQEGTMQCLLTDFGLARQVAGDEAARTRTNVGPLVMIDQIVSLVVYFNRFI